MGRGRWIIVLAVTVVALGAAATAGGAQEGEGVADQPRVDAAVQVTTTPQAARAHAAPQIAVHPDDPSTLAIAEADAFSGACGLRVSTDAGLTWTARRVPLPAEWPSCVQANLGPIAAVTFGPDGTLYYAFSGTDTATYRSRMFLARSTDLGRTFDVSEVPWVRPDLDDDEFGADALPSVAVDPNDADRVYVGWMSNNSTWNLSEEVRQGKEYFWDIQSRAYVAASSDGGATFGEAVDVAGDTAGWMSEPHLAVGTDGTVHAFFGQNVKAAKDSPEGTEAPPAHLFHAASRDGGATWDTQAVHTRPRQEGSDWLSGPSPAVNPQNGDVYVVWEETTGGPPRVAFARSQDDGASWSDPVVVNDVEPRREWTFPELFPSLSVAPNGRLDVAWYDWRNDPAFDPEAQEPDNRFQDVFASHSTDGGRTWSPDVRVTDRLIDRSLGIAESHGLWGPVAVASTNRAAFVAWSDTRNSSERTQSQDIYVTRVRHAEAGAIFGGDAVGASGWLYGALGAAGALAVGGLLLLLGVPRAGHRRRGRAVVHGR